MSCTQCATIVVTFHGEQFALHMGMMLLDFLQGRGYESTQRMACAINNKVVPQALYTSTPLKDGDRIDVIAPNLPS